MAKKGPLLLSADSEFILETVLHPWYLNSYFMNVSEKGSLEQVT